MLPPVMPQGSGGSWSFQRSAEKLPCSQASRNFFQASGSSPIAARAPSRTTGVRRRRASRKDLFLGIMVDMRKTACLGAQRPEIDQSVPADRRGDRPELACADSFLREVDELVPDAALLEEPLRLAGIRAFPRPEYLQTHDISIARRYGLVPLFWQGQRVPSAAIAPPPAAIPPHCHSWASSHPTAAC